MRRPLAVAAIVAVGLSATGIAAAQISSGVPSANPRVGTPADVLATGYSLTTLARGTDALENPSGLLRRYGFVSDGGAGAGFPTPRVGTRSPSPIRTPTWSRAPTRADRPPASTTGGAS